MQSLKQIKVLKRSILKFSLEVFVKFAAITHNFFYFHFLSSIGTQLIIIDQSPESLCHLDAFALSLFLAVLLPGTLGAWHFVPYQVGKVFLFNGKAFLPSFYFLSWLVRSLLFGRALRSYAVIHNWTDRFILLFFDVKSWLNFMNSFFEILVLLNFLFDGSNDPFSDALDFYRFGVGALLELFDFEQVNHFSNNLL